MSQALNKVEDGDLYAVLALSSKEDLDPLVQVLLAKTSNFIESNETYKKYQPDHTKYYNILGDDIRFFGGHTVMNAARQEGPPYSELVDDVCWKLSVPYKKGDTVENESNLLDLFLEKQWQSIGSEERDKFASEARNTANGEVSYWGWSAKTTAASFLLGTLSGPAGWAAFGLSLLGTAYKVTVPCVLHIAHLRRKILAEQRGVLTHQKKPRSYEQSLEGIQNCSDSISIETEDGTPMLSIKRVSPFGGEGWHKIDGLDEGINRLSPLLQAAPSLVTAGEVATTNYMEVICNGPLVKARSGGGYRGMTISDGVKSHANLFDASRLSDVVNASALMNVASVALAQKHLADISKKLGDLKDSVNEVSAFQKNERRSVLTSSIQYFEQISPSIIEGNFHQHRLEQIERHEVDILRVQNHLFEDIIAKVEEIRALKSGDWLGSKDIHQKIEKCQGTIRELYQEALLCLRARAYGWQLLCVFPGDEKVKENRRSDIISSMEKLGDSGKLIRDIDDVVRKKISEVSSSLFPLKANERKLSLIRMEDNLLKCVSSERSQIMDDIRVADEMRDALQRPIRLALRVEGDRIEAIKAM